MMQHRGPLLKWTNLVNGWQYRYCILQMDVGILSYYTTPQKARLGSRKGCVRLKNAVVGVEDEVSKIFTITDEEGKTFHFEARSNGDRDHWISLLQNTISQHSVLNLASGDILAGSSLQRLTEPKDRGGALSHLGSSPADYDAVLKEADQYLSLIVRSKHTLHAKLHDQQHPLQDDEAQALQSMLSQVEKYMHCINSSMVHLQIAKKNMQCADDGLSDGKQRSMSEILAMDLPAQSVPRLSAPPSSPPTESDGGARSSPVPPASVPAASYSSDEDESDDEFFDVPEDFPEFPEFHPNNNSGSSAPSGENQSTSGGAAADCVGSRLQETNGVHHVDLQSPILDVEKAIESSKRVLGESQPAAPASGQVQQRDVTDSNGRPDSQSDLSNVITHEDQEEDDDEVDFSQHKSVIRYLLSQVKIGMDLTRVTLPTFILERRSLLEMFADFFSNPHYFTSVSALETPRERFLYILKWYLSSFRAGRKPIAKKPYNPILGEFFQCYYSTAGRPGTGTTAGSSAGAEPSTEGSQQSLASEREGSPSTDGPVPWASRGDVAFIAEQVSHHPPISCFYAEAPDHLVQITGHMWTKSKFLGLSIGVHMIGEAVLKLLQHGESYRVTFPSAYGRNILGVPWSELGGSCVLECPQSKFRATIDFHPKPFMATSMNNITAKLFDPTNRQFATVKGQWTGVMNIQYSQNQPGPDPTAPKEEQEFVNTNVMVPVKKRVRPLEEQRPTESRRLWREVTEGLASRRIDDATTAKRALEDKQRAEAKHRAENRIQYKPKMFEVYMTVKDVDHYRFTQDLESRLNSRGGRSTAAAASSSDPSAK